jgi:type I restriction enzyme, S subunit
MREELKPFGTLLAYPLRSGVTVPKDSRGTGIRLVNMRELFRYPRLGNVDMERVLLDVVDKDRFLLKEGDLLFARRSLTAEGAGKCCIVVSVPEETTWESSIIRARLATEVVEPEFYYYFFSSDIGRRSIETIVEQVAAAGIRSSDLAKLMVPVPSLAKQQGIVSILRALDDKVALNGRIAGTYEELLRLRFEELEIDANPESSPAMTVSEILEFNPTLPTPRGDDAVYLDMAAVPTNGATVLGWSRRQPKSGTRFANGDTVMARITPCLENGKTAFIDFMKDGEVGVGSTEFIVMRARSGIPIHLPYFLARSPRFRSYAAQNMIGSSGRQRVNATQLVDFPIRRPASDNLSTFGVAASNAFAHMRSLTDESRNLAELRDTLLPKLMSGEIRVRDAEKVVEDVT